jgi:hypothetical protein
MRPGAVGARPGLLEKRVKSPLRRSRSCHGAKGERPEQSEMQAMVEGRVISNMSAKLMHTTFELPRLLRPFSFCSVTLLEFFYQSEVIPGKCQGNDPLAARRRALPAGLEGPQVAQRPAVRGRRPVAAAHRLGVLAGHLPVVLRGRPDPLVVAGPAHGALPGRAQGVALAEEVRRARGLRDALRHRLPRRDRGLRRAARRPVGHLDRPRDGRGLRAPARAGLRAFRRVVARGQARGRPLRHGAGRRLLRRVHVRAAPRTPPRSRWCAWWSACAGAAAG